MNQLDVITPFVHRLTHLNLERNNFGREGARLLASAWARASATEPVTTLVSLNLSCADIADEGLVGLAPHIPTSVTKLVLRIAVMSDVGACALADRLGELNKLTELNVAQNGIGSVGMSALAETMPASVTCLDISSNNFDAESFRELERRCFGNLESLHVRENELGSDGLDAICENASAEKLRVLNLVGIQALTHGGPGDDFFHQLSAQSLASIVEKFTRLTKLFVGENGLCTEHLNLFAPHLPETLMDLDMHENNFDSLHELNLRLATHPAPALTSMAVNKSFFTSTENNLVDVIRTISLQAPVLCSTLTYLDVGGLSMKRGGGDIIMDMLTHGMPHALRTLRMSSCGMDVQSARMLARVMPRSVVELDISSNRNIGDDGFTALIPHFSHINRASLNYANISDVSGELLLAFMNSDASAQRRVFNIWCRSLLSEELCERFVKRVSETGGVFEYNT